MKRTNFTDTEKEILEIASNLANSADDTEQDQSEAPESEEYSYQREFSDTRSTESEDDYEEHTHCVHRRAPVQIRTYDCSRAHFCHHGNWH